ncbi:hypothetical protein F4802DRAFT_599909 [Xylaria palmicola]|nr:hypothetical protein F4802DRAFT_599909 [Xylaria palmicola]
MSIVITEVDRGEDLPSLAEINRRTFLQELPSHFAYKPAADNDIQLAGFFQDRLVGRLSQPNVRMFKAVDRDTNQIHGFACWRHVKEDGAPVAPAPGSPGPPAAKTTAPQLPRFMNAEFTATTGAEVKQLEDHMQGEHYYLTAFAVDPSRQNEGIGASLLKAFIEAADTARLPAWLVAFPGSHSLYLRHGFVDVDYRDNDLNVWDNNRCRGYGIYLDHKAEYDSLHVEVYRFNTAGLSKHAPLRPKRDLLWWSFVVALLLQIGVAIIPLTPAPGRQKPNFYILLITVAGNLLSLITGSLQATHGEKYGRNRSLACRDMFALTKGNGYNIAIIILPISFNKVPEGVPNMPYLAQMATASYRSTKTSKVRAFILGGLWIVLLLVIGGASADSWYLLLVGGIGTVHTVFVAGKKRASEAHGIPLTRFDEKEWQRVLGLGLDRLSKDAMISIAEKQLARLDEQGLRDEIQGHVNVPDIPASAIRNTVIHQMEHDMSDSQRKAFTEHLVRNLDGNERMMRFIAARRQSWQPALTTHAPITQPPPTTQPAPAAEAAPIE